MTEKKGFLIAHLTDLRPDGGVAFAHSVAIAQVSGAELVSLNAGTGGEQRPMPDGGNQLKAWTDAAPKFTHKVVIHTCCDDPVDTLLDGLRPMKPDLIIAGTHQWTGLTRAFRGSVTETVAAHGVAPTLVLPIGEPGFIDEATGEFRLKKILIPVGDSEEIETAIAAITDLLLRLEIEDIDLYLLRVEGEVPADLLTQEGPNWRWHTLERSGDLIDSIIHTCEEVHCDLVVMASRGKDGFLDLFRGTHTQQVMRKVSRPLLAIPQG